MGVYPNPVDIFSLLSLVGGGMKMDRLLNEIGEKDLRISWMGNTIEKIVRLPIPILFEGIFPKIMLKDYLRVFTFESVGISPYDTVSIHINKDKGWVTFQHDAGGWKDITIIKECGLIEYIDKDKWKAKDKQ